MCFGLVVVVFVCSVLLIVAQFESGYVDFTGREVSRIGWLFEKSEIWWWQVFGMASLWSAK